MRNGPRKGPRAGHRGSPGTFPAVFRLDHLVLLRRRLVLMLLLVVAGSNTRQTRSDGITTYGGGALVALLGNRRLCGRTNFQSHASAGARGLRRFKRLREFPTSGDKGTDNSSRKRVVARVVRWARRRLQRRGRRMRRGCRVRPGVVVDIP